MSLTELSVRRPVTGIMVFMALTVLGVFTFTRLKLDMLPDITFPIIAVITQYQGAGPESIEQLVTRPIEEAMASVQGVEDVNSSSSQGLSLVLLKFAWGSDMDQAETDVRRNLEVFAKDALPDDAAQPITFMFDPSMQPVVFMAVNAPGTLQSARDIAENDVEPYLARLPGVASADVLGGTKREIQVRLEPAWLEAYRIPASQVVAALRGSNVIFPGGRLEQGRQDLNINTSAQLTSVQQIRETVVGQRGGVPVLARDVARIVDTFEEQTSVVRANDQNAVMLAVRKQSDANTVQVARRVVAEMPELEKRLPAGVKLERLFDQGEPITLAISNLSNTALLAILLTAVVLLAFLRSWRTSFIVLVSIPLSVLVTFAVMDNRGVSLNIISMAGLALAVGMLVDNSIVVLENIFTHMSRGKDAATAAIQGTAEMAMPITASTLTTVVVFAPILFVPGMAGQLFKDMSLTIVISLLASLLVALTLVPLMASLLLAHRIKRGLSHRVLHALTFWIEPMTAAYGRALAVALRNRRKTLLAAFLIFAGTLALFPLMGIDFMAKTDEGHLRFSVKAAPGTAVGTTDQLFRQAEAIAREAVPEAEVVVSQFGSGASGFAALFGNTSSNGTLQLRLKPRRERARSQQQIEDLLVERFKAIPGVEIKAQAGGLSFGATGDVQIKVFGDDLKQLTEYGSRLKTRLETVPGVANPTFSLEEGRPELQIDLDREQIRLLGLSAAEVAGTITTYFLGTTATMFRDGGDEYKVLVRAPREVRESIEALRALPVLTPRGSTVPLSTVADIRPALGPTTISRENQRRLGSVSINARVGTPLGTLIENVEKTLVELPAPHGVSTVVAGTAEDLRDSFQALAIAFLVAVLLVYMVMAAQFESLLEPFVILFSVPLALSGVILALVVTRTTMQVTALVGLILLAGVAVNNGIVLIDVLKHKRAAGEDLAHAAVDAGRSRLRPILMTTLTTILGMLPLAFEIGDGSELWAPMARTVIGGMVVSTVLTLVVMPVFYVSLAGVLDRRRARREAKLAARDEAIKGSGSEEALPAGS